MRTSIAILLSLLAIGAAQAEPLIGGAKGGKPSSSARPTWASYSLTNMSRAKGSHSGSPGAWARLEQRRSAASQGHQVSLAEVERLTGFRFDIKPQQSPPQKE